MLTDPRGSAAVESVFGMLLVLFLGLGVIQVAFVLYGRNVVVSAAHEGARAGVELGRNPSDAASVARETVRHAAGGLVSKLSVEVSLSGTERERRLHVDVTGTLDGFGPLAVSIPVRASAVSTLEESAL